MTASGKHWVLIAADLRRRLDLVRVFRGRSERCVPTVEQVATDAITALLATTGPIPAPVTLHRRAPSGSGVLIDRTTWVALMRARMLRAPGLPMRALVETAVQQYCDAFTASEAVDDGAN